MADHDDLRFTEEALKSQDGRTVPLRAYPSGPVIGEATFKYVEGDTELHFDAQITDPEFVKLMAEEAAPHIFSRKPKDRPER